MPPSPTRCWPKSSCGAIPAKYENEVYVLHEHLDEKVAALHLDKLGVKLAALSAAQADYLGLPSARPFKPEHYRY